MKLCILISIVMGVFAWMQKDCLVSVWLPKKDFHLLVVVRFLPKSIWTQQSRLSVGSFFNNLSIVYKHLRIGFLCIEPAKNIRTLTAFVVVV